MSYEVPELPPSILQSVKERMKKWIDAVRVKSQNTSHKPPKLALSPRQSMEERIKKRVEAVRAEVGNIRVRFDDPTDFSSISDLRMALKGCKQSVDLLESLLQNKQPSPHK